MNAIFPFTRTAFKCLCLVVLFLFGGVSVEHNTISLGTTSCQAITVNRLPAKGKIERKLNRFYSHTRRIAKNGIPDWAPLGLLIFMFIPAAFLLGLGIVFVTWAINLFIASNIFGGILAFMVGGTFLYLLFRFLTSDFLNDGKPWKIGG